VTPELIPFMRRLAAVSGAIVSMIRSASISVRRCFG
jgi:hypothetical protein